jgi:hypothetical protein
VFFCGFIASSSSNHAEKHPNNKLVRLIQKHELKIVAGDNVPDCHYLGEVIGSEGHWYNYLFISNRKLTQGALNDMYNRANVVYVSDDINFATSVTFYGQAYFCNYLDPL